MDSLSQIVLGAAVGEAVLGRRIGNRAMVWGAVAGTIPDMDVLGKYFLSELDNLAFHRGTAIALFFVRRWFRMGNGPLHCSAHHARIAMATAAAAAVMVGFVVNFLTQIVAPGGWIPLVAYIPLVGWWWWRHGQTRYFSGNWTAPDADLKGWVLLFFWGFLTHTLLDCFTTYGTQLYAPFSDERVAWCTIAVADPLWTFPFLACLLVAARFAREDCRRRIGTEWVWFALLYLALTVANHGQVKRTFEAALEAQGKSHQQLFITQTIFNNVSNAVEDGTATSSVSTPSSMRCRSSSTASRRGPPSQPGHRRDAARAAAVQRRYQCGDARGRIAPAQRPPLRHLSGRGEWADDYIFDHPIDNGPDQPYGFSRAQGGPPDQKGEEMMEDLIDRAGGLKADSPS